MSRDIDKEISPAVSIVAAAKTTSTNGTGVDLSGYDSAFALVTTGVITDGTHTPKLQDSADNSTFADVSAGNLSGAFTAITSGAGGSSTQRVGYLGSARYLRVVMTVSGTTTGGLYAATIIRGNARLRPTT